MEFYYISSCWSVLYRLIDWLIDWLTGMSSLSGLLFLVLLLLSSSPLLSPVLPISSQPNNQIIWTQLTNTTSRWWLLHVCSGSPRHVISGCGSHLCGRISPDSLIRGVSSTGTTLPGGSHRRVTVLLHPQLPGSQRAVDLCLRLDSAQPQLRVCGPDPPQDTRPLSSSMTAGAQHRDGSAQRTRRRAPIHGSAHCGSHCGLIPAQRSVFRSDWSVINSISWVSKGFIDIKFI